MQTARRLTCASLILAAVIAVGCAEQKSDSPWARVPVGDLSIRLVDPSSQETLRFCRDHTVTAEYGTNDTMVGAILAWKVRNGRLDVYNDDLFVESLELVSNEADSLTVRNREGERVVYKKLPRTTKC